MVRDLILGFVPGDWLQSLDFSTLEPVSGHYVSDDLRERADDVVWRVKAGQEWLYLYLLIEFQSKVDPFMALRVLVYVGLLYQDLIKRKQLNASKKLPPVLPIVLYNGQRSWTAATELAELLPKMPGFLRQYTPRMRYVLIDESRYSDEELASKKNLVAALFRLEQTVTPDSIDELIGNLSIWLSEDSQLARMMAIWIRAVFMRNPQYRMILPEVDNLQELKIMLSERVKQWAQDYEAKGRMEGRVEGQMEGLLEGRRAEASATLLRLLQRRFGQISDQNRTVIEQAELELLEMWLDRILDAKTLDEVFVPADSAH